MSFDLKELKKKKKTNRKSAIIIILGKGVII